MSDKTALVILSEIVQSLEDLREIAHEVGHPDHLSDEQVAAEEWSAEKVHEYEASFLSEGDQEAATALLAGCRKIEEKVIEMIELCLEFTPPL
jgi:hypothetical protein